MSQLTKIFGKISLFFILCSSTCAWSVQACPWSGFFQKNFLKPAFTIDFRKPEYKTTIPCTITHDEGTEFNPTCGKSWKLDSYNADTNQFSYMEIEVIVNKDDTKNYALELQACARKDPPLWSKVSIAVNDLVVAQGYNMYGGPDSIHFRDRQGKPSHMRWEVFDISNELVNGTNKIRISLDSDTQSGISMSWLHIRPAVKPAS